MRPNFVNTQFDFYGVKDFQGNSEWPKPSHANEWLKRHYTYTLCDSLFGRYQLDVTMISGRGLADRMAIDVLRVDYGSQPENASEASQSFRTNTHLQTRFEIHMNDLAAEKNAWAFYQSQRNMAIEFIGFGYDQHADRLLEDAGIIRQRLVDELETELRRNNIKMVVEGQPRLSSMLIDIFTEYKDTVYDWNPENEPIFKLVKNG